MVLNRCIYVEVNMLIAIDGPNGVGKSTFIEQLNDYLNKEGISIFITKEPTNTTLGNFVRKFAEEDNNRTTVAYLVATDRYNHFYTEIKPLLMQSKIVVCDRYIMSSFILQGMDGIDEHLIEELNHNVQLPDLQIVLTASPSIIDDRLLNRDCITRYEKEDREKELFFTEKAYEWMVNKGVETLHLKNDNIEDLANNITIVKNAILRRDNRI